MSRIIGKKIILRELQKGDYQNIHSWKAARYTYHSLEK